jgi:hypothetical protein
VTLLVVNNLQQPFLLTEDYKDGKKNSFGKIRSSTFSPKKIPKNGTACIPLAPG